MKAIFLRRSFLFLVSLLFLFALLLGGCLKKEPIRIGFVADLTGKQAELGVQERNGVQLAVDNLNASGGIAGRPIELLIQDDLGTGDGARAAIHQLLQANVAAIIGHATSAQTTLGLQLTDPAKIVLLSPTASTPDLSGKSPYFFRVYPTFLDSARGFASYVYQDHALKKIAILADSDNAAYAFTYRDVFSDKYTSLGGSVVKSISYASSKQPDFAPLLKELRQGEPDGLLLVTSDIDAALIAQRARLMGWRVLLFASAWAQTEILLHNGGMAVEGMEIEQAYALDNENQAFSAFKQQYQARFGRAPSFGASFGYEAASVLANALKKTGGQREGLRQALLDTKDFPGLLDTISFSANGDVVRPFYLSTIRNGKFVILATLSQAKQ
ncbi:ABC transporter substrate-binding protein [Azotosporobacter soli]|uniref:ABC transporter substrate-binding protein n=1 Tax=Azotosporobacter soli TaxID=3055040 RepID=UPI0031FE7736